MNLANHYITDQGARLSLGLPVAGVLDDDGLHHRLADLYATAPDATISVQARPIHVGPHRGQQAVTVLRIYPDGGVLPLATAVVPAHTDPAQLATAARTAAADLATAA